MTNGAWRNRAAALLALALPLLPSKLPAQRFPNGLSSEPTYFPIGVWLQDPANAVAYRELGINLYVGLHDGPRQGQLEQLERAGMRVFCERNPIAQSYAGPAIAGWLLPDEPDNAQGRRLRGYRPPVEPWRIATTYAQLHEQDGTRPVLLNLGQGVAWDGWHGRGERSGHAEDYPEYAKAGDVLSFDIYPVTHPHPDVRGRLEFTGRGVRRLLACSDGKKPVWAVIATGHVDDARTRPTPQQLRCMVWQAIACGASGIVYFVHEFEPRFDEASLLTHDDVRQAVRALNQELLAAAPMLHGPAVPEALRPLDANDDTLAVRVHEHDGAWFAFVASLSPEPRTVTFAADGIVRAQALDEPREVTLADGMLRDPFDGYGVRRYRLER